METEEIQEKIRQRLGMSGRVVIATVFVGLALFSLILTAFYWVSYDSQIVDANNQMRLFVLSNTENFEMRNDRALKKAAVNLTRGKLVSHIVVYNPRGEVTVMETSKRMFDEFDTGADHAEFNKIGSKSKLVMATSGSDLVRMKLPSGRVLLRAYTPVRKGPQQLGDFEMGFFKSEITSRAIESLQIPAAVAVSSVLFLSLIVLGAVRRWERSKTGEVSQFFESTIDQITEDFTRKFDNQKREADGKDMDGGNFFNIMESVRDVATAADKAMFIRRAVLSSVRLFRCRMVTFYIVDSANATAAWKLVGRYDGKGYAHDTQESLDPSVHKRLAEAVKAGSTEILEGYPAANAQSLIIGISTSKPVGIILLSNKVGVFDAKDIVAARAFAGFLPNLFAWHIK